VRVHVTGERGFVARHLLRELADRGHETSATDVEHALAPELIVGYGGVPSEELPDSPDVIVHAGAIVGRELRGMGTQRAIELNTTSTALLASAAAAAGIPLVYLSTSEVYGPRDGAIAFEDDPLTTLPHNLYGLTKRWGEETCRLAYAGRPELLTIARLSMPYGPGHLPGSGRAALTNFLWAAMRGDPLVVHRGASRSWCWIGDTVRALATLAEYAADRGSFGPSRTKWFGYPAVYNVGRDDNETSMADVADLALETVFADEETTAHVYLVDPPAGYSLSKRLDVSRLHELGWRPTVELDEGIGFTYRWLRETAPSLIA
jgi:nucleoside-diphosphate-sugar epimerase